MMGAVFAMQGFGQLTGALVALISVAGFKHALESGGNKGVATCVGDCQLACDKIWRILIGERFPQFSLLEFQLG